MNARRRRKSCTQSPSPEIDWKSILLRLAKPAQMHRERSLYVPASRPKFSFSAPLPRRASKLTGSPQNPNPFLPDFFVARLRSPAERALGAPTHRPGTLFSCFLLDFSRRNRRVAPPFLPSPSWSPKPDSAAGGGLRACARLNSVRSEVLHVSRSEPLTAFTQRGAASTHPCTSVPPASSCVLVT